jgi:hypothetical protein
MRDEHVPRAKETGHDRPIETRLGLYLRREADWGFR